MCRNEALVSPSNSPVWPRSLPILRTETLLTLLLRNVERAHEPSVVLGRAIRKRVGTLKRISPLCDLHVGVGKFAEAVAGVGGDVGRPTSPAARAEPTTAGNQGTNDNPRHVQPRAQAVKNPRLRNHRSCAMGNRENAVRGLINGSVSDLRFSGSLFVSRACFLANARRCKSAQTTSQETTIRDVTTARLTPSSRRRMPCWPRRRCPSAPRSSPRSGGRPASGSTGPPSTSAFAWRASPLLRRQQVVEPAQRARRGVQVDGDVRQPLVDVLALDELLLRARPAGTPTATSGRAA